MGSALQLSGDRAATAAFPAAVNRLVARVLLAVFGCLTALTVLPAIVGMHPYVITSSSMTPQVNPGDLVVASRVPAAALRPGQVIVFADPQVPGRTLTHRVKARNADGTLTTQGDNNGTADTAPVPPGNVQGLARLRIPAVGLPAYWFVTGQLVPIAVVTLVALGLVGVACRRLPGEAPAAPARGGRHRAPARTRARVRPA